MSGGAIAIDKRAASRRRRLVVENVQAFLFLLPAFAVLLVFKVFPSIYAIYISFFKWDIIQGAFRGLDNYGDILFGARAETFWRSVSTTLTYALITVPIEIGLALVIAYLLFQKIRGRSVYRTIYYLPYMRFLQEPNGIFDMIGNRFNVDVPAVAAGPSLALVSVAIFSIWHFLGFQIVIFLGGLGNIPVEYYEAARLDGASQRQVFTKITLPLLTPQIFFVFTIASIGVLRAFNEIFVLTNGGPLDTTRTVSMLVFRTFFQQGQIGYGSAMGVLLTLLILGFTLLQFRFLERRVQYG